MPTAAATHQVRALDAKAFELNAYMRQPEVAPKRLAAYGVEAPAAIRRATEAEIMQTAAALDAGEALNPRLWNERMTVLAQRVAA